MYKLTKKHLESILKYIQQEKDVKTPSNIILAGIEGRIVGIIENIEELGLK